MNWQRMNGTRPLGHCKTNSEMETGVKVGGEGQVMGNGDTQRGRVSVQ